MKRFSPNHEPTVWLRESVQARLEFYDQVIRGAPPNTVVLAFLTDVPVDPRARKRWENTCDRCGTHQPPPTPMIQLTVMYAGQSVLMSLGLCDACYALEIPNPDDRDA
jgi:hypothetical protein